MKACLLNEYKFGPLLQGVLRLMICRQSRFDEFDVADELAPRPLPRGAAVIRQILDSGSWSPHDFAVRGLIHVRCVKYVLQRLHTLMQHVDRYKVTTRGSEHVNCHSTSSSFSAKLQSAQAAPRTDGPSCRSGEISLFLLRSSFLNLDLYLYLCNLCIRHHFLPDLGLRSYAEESSTNTDCLPLSLWTPRGGEAVRFNSV